jgi:hypothetical protein
LCEKIKNGMLTVFSMPKHFFLLTISTFVFGFVTGAILFLVTNTGGEGDGGLDTSTRGIEVVVRAYGGCEMLGAGRCPTYRIGNDGAYTYIHLDDEAEVVQSRGELSNTQMATLRRLVRALEGVSHPPFTGTCPIASDGLAFTYEVTSDGVVYTYDSCEDALEGEALFETLNDYFESFDMIHRTE